MDNKKTIEALQFFVTNLTASAFVHKLQGKIFSAQGFSKLGKKYADHYAEEMAQVDLFIDRIMDLDGVVIDEDKKGTQLISHPVEYLHADAEIQAKGLEMLRECMQGLKDDPVTYEMLRVYLKEEEEDYNWDRQQLELISLIGEQNWLLQQL